jgi:hypothetical protein
MQGRTPKPQGKRWAVGAASAKPAADRAPSSQPSSGPTAPRLTTSSLGWWAAASRQAPRCTPLIFVIALAYGLGAM